MDGAAERARGLELCRRHDTAPKGRHSIAYRRLRRFVLATMMAAAGSNREGSMIDPMGGPAYWWPFVAGFAIAYLIGSVPFGLILTRLAGAGDVRNIGSGNIGATNVLRTGRKGLALATLVLDLLKGALPVWLAFRYLGPDMALVAGLGAVLGHCFPVWLKFRGGKGVATAGGVVVALTPTVAAVAIGVFVLVVLATRYVSLGSVLGALAAAPAAYVMGYAQAAELYLLLALIILAKHAANLRRLAQGTEARLELRRSPDSA